MYKRTARVFFGSLCLIAASVAPLIPDAVAQSYPTKPVHIVVPFPPGGGLDTVTRSIQPRLSEFLGQPVVIENRPGAAGLLGTTQVAKSAPDGYTLLSVFDTHVVNQHLYKEAPDIFSAFDAVSLMVSTPQLLVAHAGFAPSTLAELIAAAKVAPGRVTYGSLGSGSSNHLGALQLSQRGGIEMLHVPFKGGAPLVQALLGKQIDMTFTFPSGVLPHIQSGRLKAIAVGGRQRSTFLPDVPAVAEFLPGFELTSWFGLVAPKGIRADIFNRIQQDVRRALKSPEVHDKLVASGYIVNASSPEEFTGFMRSESDKLGKLIRDNGIKVE